MKCPKCNKAGSCKYIEPRKTNFAKKEDRNAYVRTDFKAKCKCGWEGEI